jgi:hypothetical protein
MSWGRDSYLRLVQTSIGGPNLATVSVRRAQARAGQLTTVNIVTISVLARQTARLVSQGI